MRDEQPHDVEDEHERARTVTVGGEPVEDRYRGEPIPDPQPRARRFRIRVGRCRGCGRQWPAHAGQCRECTALIGDVHIVACARLVPPEPGRRIPPMLAAVAAIELSCRSARGDTWVGAAWRELAPALADAALVRPGPAGTVVASWRLDHPQAVAALADRALGLAERMAGRSAGDLELRGGVIAGVVGATTQAGDAERVAERLALAAAPCQWLVAVDVARRLQPHFELRPAGPVPRWPMPHQVESRALAGPLAAPVLASAVAGERPAVLIGRSTERARLLAELELAAAGHRRVVLLEAPAGGGKSYLLRHLLTDPQLPVDVAAGVAFPPLGARRLGPVQRLHSSLTQASADALGARALGCRLGEAASERARGSPAAVVVDDVHWADPDASGSKSR